MGYVITCPEFAFPAFAPVANPVFFRTYSRRTKNNRRESWLEVSDRTVSAIGAIGDLTKQEMDLIKEVQDNLHGTVSGRFLWIGGTEWHKKPENYSGAFNCTSLMFDSLSVFGKTMDLTMMGCGVGVVLEPRYISKLPSVKNHINVEIKGNFGDVKSSRRTESTNYFLNSKENIYEIVVGDSRQGWAEAYQSFIDAAFAYPNYNKIVINISQIRPAYEKINGFGGISEPTKFAQMFPKLAKILNGALGRQLTSVEICLLVDEAALVVVAGNVRRCLPEDALVFTNNGLIPIRDIQVGDLVETPIGLRSVTAKFNQGFQDVYTLNVHSDIPLDGNYPRATLNHRIATRVGDSVKWVAISELVEGDKLVYLDTSSPKPYLPFNPMFTGLGDCKYMQTYDIEVDEVHCFYADGFLTHNSAGMRQFDKDDQLAAVAKENLWRQDETGHWSIDPDRDALRMANHTRVYHQKPTLEECINAVRKQYYSGEGAIQWAGEAVARANADLIEDETEKHNFIKAYQSGLGREWLGLKAPKMSDDELDHRMKRYGLNPCGEIIGSDFHCNLAEVELNMINPLDFDAQHEAFTAMSLSVAALLKQGFVDPLYQHSRELDPIVGVSFTGLFDYFVNAFGIKWLEWWQAGRPKKWGDIVSNFNQFTDLIYPYDLDKLGLLSYEYLDRQHLSWWFTQIETLTLRRWKILCENVIKSYCQKHGIKTPNRCTTVQPSGTKVLLTGGSPGWHPPKAAWVIRRVTVPKNDPVALACLDYGYNIVPSADDKDDEGNLLYDIFDSNCQSWLVEIPLQVSWGDLPGLEDIDINKFSALAQFDFYSIIQREWTGHNTSATIELRKDEIEELATAIYENIQNDEGYISAALLARFDDCSVYPRLPFEPITKEKYDQLHNEVLLRRVPGKTFEELLAARDLQLGYTDNVQGPAGCDSDKCLL